MSKFVNESLNKEVDRLLAALVNDAATTESIAAVKATSDSLTRVFSIGVEDLDLDRESYNDLLRINLLAALALKGFDEYKPEFCGSMERTNQEYFEHTLNWFAKKGGDYRKLCFLVGGRAA